MIYFAYGSNMDPAQMQARCAGSRTRGIGFLADHRLGFPRWSDKRRHAVASIEACPGASVWGVLYDMTAEDWTCLNGHEGHLGAGHAGNGYDIVAVDIAAAGAVVAAHTYVARPNPRRPRAGLTSARYMQLLINGAVARGLPADYIARLRAVPTFD